MKNSKYQTNGTFLTMKKPVEVNLAGDGSEMSEDETLVKSIYLNITSEKLKKKKSKEPKSANVEKKTVARTRGIKSPVMSRFNLYFNEIGFLQLGQST